MSLLTGTARQKAENWIADQEAQQQAEEPTMPLESVTFTFGGVVYQKGTDRTPTDAITIQRYNGAYKYVIFWQNKTATQPGSWQVRPDMRHYVDLVSGHIP